ncbi:MAG: leucyl aminopeptidase [Micrococcales bacterium]
MANMQFDIIKNLPKPSKSSALVLAVQKQAKHFKVVLPEGLALPVFENLDVTQLVTSELNRMLHEGTVVILAKVPEKATTQNLRELGGSISRTLGEFTELTLAIPTQNKAELLALTEGLALGNYSFTKLKSSADVRKLRSVKIFTNSTITKAEIARVQTIAEHVHEIRDLVNTPANLLYPSEMAKWASAQAKKYSLQIEVWDEKRLEKEKCGGILGVGQGSARPPRLIKLTHKPRGAKFKLALVGKGITFDTGGLSLKPGASMLGMKYDMTGAATVLNAVLAIARLNLPIEVTAWACVAENMPSGTATRPNDVVRARNGKTIEITNTDAEGRVVLADGLSLASETKPDLIVDLATLTGAATVALGNRYAGLMGAEDAVEKVKAAANNADELVWHMPLASELRALLDSQVADIANAKVGNTAGGMLIGGLFLQEFISKDSKGELISWAHLDIAGPAKNDAEAYGYVPKGGTGALIRTLVSLAESLIA